MYIWLIAVGLFDRTAVRSAKYGNPASNRKWIMAEAPGKKVKEDKEVKEVNEVNAKFNNHDAPWLSFTISKSVSGKLNLAMSITEWRRVKIDKVKRR